MLCFIAQRMNYMLGNNNHLNSKHANAMSNVLDFFYIYSVFTKKNEITNIFFQYVDLQM